jgi:hypothetical protein
MVASGLDFFTGMTAAGDELVLGAALALGLDFGAAGEEDLLGEGEAFGFGEGDVVFSVVIDTEGSDELVSGGAGEALSSWAKASGAAANRTARQKTVIFIGFS